MSLNQCLSLLSLASGCYCLCVCLLSFSLLSACSSLFALSCLWVCLFSVSVPLCRCLSLFTLLSPGCCDQLCLTGPLCRWWLEFTGSFCPCLCVSSSPLLCLFALDRSYRGVGWRESSERDAAGGPLCGRLTAPGAASAALIRMQRGL